MTSRDDVIMLVSHVSMEFDITNGLRTIGTVKALDDVTFKLYEGETLGIVGETGCGKTTLSRAILRLIRATNGDIYFDLPAEVMGQAEEIESRFDGEPESKGTRGRISDGADKMDAQAKEFRHKHSITRMRRGRLGSYRAKVQPVFQDPFGSLDPRKLVKDIIAEPMRLLRKYKSREIIQIEKRLIREIGLEVDHLYRFPHEFSGGQRQRIGIMRSIAVEPKLLILDEPTSALDVSVQSQILNLLLKLQEDKNLTYIFISHHMNVVRLMSDRIAVMYLGQIVEMARTDELFSDVLHPYSQALLKAIPVADPFGKKTESELEGEVPSPSDPPKGCRFHTRCPVSEAVCGWSPKDFKHHFSEFFDPLRNKEASGLPSLKKLELKEENFYISMTFAESLKQTDLETINRIIREESKKKNGAKFGAIIEIKRGEEENNIKLSLLKPRRPRLQEVKDGHFVRCFLHEVKGEDGA